MMKQQSANILGNEISLLQSQLDIARADIVTLTAENRRLRNRLEAIELAGRHSTVGHDVDCTCATCWLKSLLHESLKVAA